MNRILKETSNSLSKADWTDLAAVRQRSHDLLSAIDGERSLLLELVEAAAKDPNLLGLCEHYDILDKLVVHDDPTGWRLRLHVFLPGYFDRPHNHRWTYSSRILKGRYTHTLYGTEESLSDEMDVSTLEARQIRTEEAGDTYTLHHSMVHAITDADNTVSLIVRGPAVKDRFLVTDRSTGKAWWQFGAANEAREDSEKKRMNPEQVKVRIETLKLSGLFD